MKILKALPKGFRAKGLLAKGLLAAALALPAPAVLAQDGGYRVRAGDVVRVEVLEDASVNRDVLVLPDGRITVPLAGPVRVAGRTLEQIQTDLAARLAPSFAAAPTVFVSLSQLGERQPASPRVINVYVMGEAANPGRFEVRPGTTLLQLMAQAGGFSRFAATKRVQLRRVDRSGVEQVYTFDYDAMTRGSAGGGATQLSPGDVIVIPQRRLFE
ncbi:MAG TPA: polysaccharide biosynthesis/export family protein [Paracoccaceae bacterium]|nr:polysaccharide biosynthesis/export family protein [Paracoccaceae bacterium]HMO70062.1 polysaccharide biosynthesis/export family protein [Paracoccaceae bacterium]